MTEYCTVYCTVPDVEVGRRLAEVVVSERLAACGNIVPAVTSIYEWDGDLCCDEEAVLLLKTVTERSDAVIRRLTELHPYDVPCVTTLPIQAIEPQYADWVSKATRAK